MLAIYGNERPLLDCPDPYCFWRSPAKFLRTMDLDQGNYWLDIVGIVVWIIVLRLAFFGILKWKLFRKRGF